MHAVIYKPHGNHKSKFNNRYAKNKKECKYITKECQQTMREESRSRKEGRRTPKTTIKK